MKNDTAVDDQARRLATSLSRGLPLGQLDDRFCSSYNGIMVGNVWTLAKGSAESEAAALLNTEGVSTDLSVIAGMCKSATWRLYAADGVSTDLDCTPQVRRPRTYAPERRLKPCRTKAFIGKFPAKWEVERMNADVVKTIEAWADANEGR